MYGNTARSTIVWCSRALSNLELFMITCTQYVHTYIVPNTYDGWDLMKRHGYYETEKYRSSLRAKLQTIGECEYVWRNKFAMIKLSQIMGVCASSYVCVICLMGVHFDVGHFCIIMMSVCIVYSSVSFYSYYSHNNVKPNAPTQI